MKKTPRLTCARPDRDAPALTCGYPLPCPHHTVIADVVKQTVTVPLRGGASITLPAKDAGRIGAITEAVKPTSTRRRRP